MPAGTPALRYSLTMVPHLHPATQCATVRRLQPATLSGAPGAALDARSLIPVAAACCSPPSSSFPPARSPASRAASRSRPSGMGRDRTSAPSRCGARARRGNPHPHPHPHPHPNPIPNPINPNPNPRGSARCSPRRSRRRWCSSRPGWAAPYRGSEFRVHISRKAIGRPTGLRPID